MSTLDLVKKIRGQIATGARIVFVSGNFNILHPGHLRLINFAAECGDYLVIGVNKNGLPGVYIDENIRAESLNSLNGVNSVIILKDGLESFLLELKPSIIVKGKEHEGKFNPESEIISHYGGTLIFSSGSTSFSSLDLLRQEILEGHSISLDVPQKFLSRHDISIGKILDLLQKIKNIKAVVVGDLIVDEYVTCDPLGMSREDPTLVVTPIARDLYVGGAGITASHGAGLGAAVSYFGVVGDDAAAGYAQEKLKSYNVDCKLIGDLSRPTTLKQRFRANGKTLLRVSHLRQHEIGADIVSTLSKAIKSKLDGANLLIFSDFNYGALPQCLVDDLTEYCSARGILMAADSQSSSQIGNIARFCNMDLLNATEYEARLALIDNTSGLVILANQLRRRSGAKNVFLKLGSEGLIIHAGDVDIDSNELITDEIQAFNSAPKDVSGAGDCMLISAALALAAGATIWEAGFIGSLAAACQVGRIGNYPLSNDDLKRELVS